ncbi:MAG: hypothetical protein PWR02_111 [Synergistales bacterium]|nr:hypothetical protein [Synergistales bacterium]
MNSLVLVAIPLAVLSSALAAIRPKVALTLIAFLTALGTFNVLGFFGLDTLWGMQPGPSKIAFYLFLPGLVVALLLRLRFPILPRTKHAVALVLILTISLLAGVFLAYDQAVAFKAWTGLVRWTVLWGLCVLLLTFEDCKWIIKLWIAFVVCVNMLYIFSFIGIGQQLAAKSFIIGSHDGRFEIIGQDPNYWATFILVTLTTLVIWRPWRSGFITSLFSLIMISGGLLTGSRSFLVTLALLSVIVAVKTIRKRPKMVACRLVSVLLFLFLIAVLSYEFDLIDALDHLYSRGLKQRSEVYLWSIYNLPKTVLVGLGPENMPLVYDQLRPTGFITSGSSSHNMYLEVLNAGGIVPLIVFAAFLVYTLKTCAMRARIPPLQESDRRFLAAIRWSILVVMLEGMFLSLAWINWVWVLLALPFLRHTKHMNMKQEPSLMS